MNASHLPFQFQHFAPGCFSVILKRLKEKQQLVVAALEEAFGTVNSCLDHVGHHDVPSLWPLQCLEWAARGDFLMAYMAFHPQELR